MNALVVATVNVQETLGSSDAGLALEQVLAHAPDVVGLQEWYPRRWPLLRPSGTVRPVPVGVRLPGRSVDGGLDWSAGLFGGCAVGVRPDRLEVQARAVHLLSWPGRADRGEGGLGLEPARVAVVVRCRDLVGGHPLGLVGYHLVHGVQRGGDYRADRPRLVARHRHEVARLAGLVDVLQEEGREVLAFGDSNFDGLRLPSLTSAWSSEPSGQGSLGRRRVDDVHARMAPASVTTLGSPSDHRAVVVRYADLL